MNNNKFSRTIMSVIKFLLMGLILYVAGEAIVDAALTIDVNRSTDRSTNGSTISSPAFTTALPNELLLAFIATDGNSSPIIVNSMSGAGLTWVLVQRANAQRGTAEVWRALAPSQVLNATVVASLSQSTAASITVVSFSGVDPSGIGGSGAIGAHAAASAASGAPSASLITTRSNSWVIGVGNDWDRAIARTPGAGQSITHQYLATVGDTYWVQQRTGPTPLAGTQVAINDTAPTGDRYNLSIVEVLPALVSGSFSISGSASPAAVAAGAVVTLGQSGATLASVTITNTGLYTLPNLNNGIYTVTPSKSGIAFTPASQSVTVNGGNVTNVNFTAALVPTWTLSGTISPASLGTGAAVSLSGSAVATTSADATGFYSFSGLSNGNFSVTPTKSGVTFTPGSQDVTISGANRTGINFTAQSLPPPIGDYPDLSDIIPPAQISVVGSGTDRRLQYTHDTFNGGAGPLEILPVYQSTSGNYQGYQHIYSFDATGKATLVQTIPIAGAFVFDSAHGHFHFPFAAYGLFPANPDGSIGSTPMAVSDKTGFCINDSFIYDSSLPNAGAFGSYPGPYGQWGSCADPTSLRGLSVGGVDEYDQTDEGQSIIIPPLLSGTFWLRAIDDPYNYFAESDKTNNETDVKIAISLNNTVTVLQTVVPVLNQPPTISLASPVAGVVSGTVALSATTAAPGAVQYLVDGLPFASAVPNAPYTLQWDTTALPNGSHWLAAQVSDSTGRVGTSAVTSVTVSNGVIRVPPTVSLTDPAAGSTVSSLVTVAANATAQVGTPMVQFYADNTALGGPISAPPFITSWNTTAVTDGTHVLTASATDQFGLTGTSAPVAVLVDNSHPANVIGIDVNISQDGTGVLQTPVFSTTTSGDLLLAFVAYDGPNSAQQTGTVSGAGLSWQLAKRSNTQLGTAEIWVAKAAGLLSSVRVSSQTTFAGYHGSLTVIAFKNASGAGVMGQAGAPTGAPSISLPGISAGNWVFAVGNDWDRAVARTPVGGQVLVHQRIDTQVGDTFWVQSTSAPTSAYGVVIIQDSAPTNDQWNYAAVEIVATH